MSLSAHHPLPAAPDIEVAMLGSYLDNPDLYASCPTSRAEYQSPANQSIHAALGRMLAASEPLNIVTLTQHLREAGRLDAVGGIVYVTSLGDPMVGGTHRLEVAQGYRAILLEKSRLRAIHLKAAAVALAALSEGADPTLLSEQMQQLLTDLARQASTGSDVAAMEQLVPGAISRMEERYAGRGKLRGIPSGLGSLDRLTGGWQPGQMIVVAAREKEGKSSLARQFVLEAAVCRDVPTAVFSHEMGREEITDALIATRARVDARRIEDGTLSDADFAKITSAAGHLAAAPIFVFDEADSSVLQFRANARRAVSEFGCRLIILDYLQLVNGTGDEDRREQEVAAVSRNAKLAAKELGIPVIVLSQLNEKGATRESRAIQQDLDRLIVIEHENPEAEGDGKAWIKVKLSRGGPKGSVPVMWRPAITCFDPLAAEGEGKQAAA